MKTLMRLFEEFLRPWSIKQDESVDPSKYGGGYEVFCANGKTVMSGGTFSGDGDGEFNLNRLQVEELVRLVNAA